MHIYDIAGIGLEVISDFHYVYEELKDFSSARNTGPDLFVDIKGSDIIDRPDGVLTENEYGIWAQSLELPGKMSLSRLSDNGGVLCRMDIDLAWKYSTITYNTNYQFGFYGLIGPMMEILFRSQIVFQQGLVIHAAGLNWQDQGILLSAPSGTGKSTQANLWKRFMNARVLNGDHTAVRIINDTPVVFGSPWSASSPDFYNGKAVLSTIVVLQQAGENSIRRLSCSEAATMLLPRCFLPSFSEVMMDMAVDTFNSLINKVPVYLLACRPEMEAVELLCRFASELNGDGNTIFSS
ncbi:MAG TPA: hypothetical protein VN426_17505 [Syntrophomonadaceae bacterium]|nr:hypothetical protein [Syntrophomonadaceae bacterium]